MRQNKSHWLWLTTTFSPQVMWTQMGGIQLAVAVQRFARHSFFSFYQTYCAMGLWPQHWVVRKCHNVWNSLLHQDLSVSGSWRGVTSSFSSVCFSGDCRFYTVLCCFFNLYLKTSSNFTANTQFLLSFAIDSWKWVPGAYLAIDRQWQQWWGGRWVGRDSCHHRCCCARHCCCCCLDECCCRPGRNSEIIALSGVLYGHNSWVLGSNRANYGRSVSPLGAHHYSNYIQRVRIIVRGNCKFVQSMCWTYLK